MGSDTFLSFSFQEEKRVSRFLSPSLCANPPSTNRLLCLSHPRVCLCVSVNKPSFSPASLTFVRNHRYEHLKRFNPLVPLHIDTFPPLSLSAPCLSSLAVPVSFSIYWLNLPAEFSSEKYSKTRLYLKSTALSQWTVLPELALCLDPTKHPLRIWNQVTNHISFKVIWAAP